ncbi:CCR4-Not complex component, Not1-domain-containing protein [Radiomyces spectabilis]|uniref:CCR4-Not complex component, Not1-domain-containing protein n=1 Tax=Radiomyces spectabilis TaxID=64574 RepID=UPI0022203093|nr:CCR4-Not complex component, Not1-domain-containing protein [Radiomyces spectabilis]KAI8372978.1 CCR4-Not complex component, Not1-domain-containing protein [Radiomyces spectabilis]
MVIEAGPDCLNAPSMIKDIISKLKRPIEPQDVAQTVGSMASTSTETNSKDTKTGTRKWNVETFVKAVKDMNSDLDWEKVFQSFDYEGFILYDAEGLQILLTAWKTCPKGMELFPVDNFFRPWRNIKGQLSVLHKLINVPVETFNVAMATKRRIIEIDDFAPCSSEIQAMASQLVNSPLNSMLLIECVLNLWETYVADDAKLFLEIMINNGPELVFLGLTQIQPIKNDLHQLLLRQLLTALLTGNAASKLVLTKLYKINGEFFKQAILEMYTRDQNTLSCIVDVAAQLKLLPTLINTVPLFLALDLAMMAFQQPDFSLETWLQGQFKERQELMALACFDFLRQKISAVSKTVNSAPTTVPLTPEAISELLRILSENTQRPENREALKEVYNACVKLYPSIANLRPMPEATETPTNETNFKPEIEAEANSYYERVYSEKISVDQLIEKLKEFHASKDPHDQDVLACMIHNLFDEFHFFPKYPEKELSITSLLFGSLIQHKLVSNVPLGIALRCVLESLRQPLGSKMFNFGLQALVQFQSQLPEWPQYCSHLLQIPDLQQANQDLYRVITSALQLDPAHMDNRPVLQVPQVRPPTINDKPDSAKSIKPMSTAAVHVPEVPTPETNLVYEAPNVAKQDKILFIINNVAQNNLASKVSELKEVLDASAYQWFSNYLVVKRASIEPNYHQLYLLLLDSVNSKLLNQHVLRETYVNIQILLNSEKTVSSSSERSLLKNLGAWLGGMTLAKNKPIKHKNIAFKDLLLEGYDNNRLIVVIPFVCKVLEQCGKSRVFRPPNPWLMAILKLLVELYQFADLKLNLKFEIEVLCKSLSLELNDIEATSVLKDRRRKDQAAKEVLPGVFGATTESPFAVRARVPGSGTLHPAAAEPTSVVGTEEFPIALPNLAPYITFNPQIPLYTSQPASKRWILQAITESIREVIAPVVERSVAIAVVSTRDLVSKDFAMESDENKIRKAAHLMVQNLAGSLAMVTSKEPLRLSMVTNLRTVFVAHGMTDALSEQAVLLTVADNLDLVCAVIEKAAVERAIVEVDEALASAYASRKKHREQRTNHAYFDMDVLSMSRYPATLPQPLRPKPNGLQPAQLRVYEDFARIPRTAPATTQAYDVDRVQRVNRADGVPYGYGNNGAAMPVVGGNAVGGFDSPVGQVSAHQILERFAQYINELKKLASQTNVASLSALPPLHDIRVIIRQIPLLAMSSFDKVEAARTFAQKVVQLLYKSETQLSIEMYVVLLERLCDVSPNVGTLVTSWLTHADDERKYNVPVTMTLIKAGLINLMEQDQELAALIDSGRPSAIDFTARLIRACFFDEPPLATRQEFSASLEALGRLRGKLPDSVLVLMEDMRRLGQPAAAKEPQDEEAVMREKLRSLFADWVRLCQHPSTTEKAQIAFVAQLPKQNVLKSEDVMSMFFRLCVETCVDHANKYNSLPGQSPNLAYQPIDALSKLIVVLVQLPAESPNPNQNASKVNQFSKILSIIVLALAQQHETRAQQFNQKPFLRIFTSLLGDLHVAEQQIQPIYIPLLTALANTFHALQPSHIPGFTFAWLQLISHRLFMPKLLLTEGQKGWATFQKLLVCLFQFLVPFLRSVELRDTTRMLYRGTLRVLLVLLHDFPEFLCDYHYSLCDVIPASCIQLRNLILSAFPRNMRLPDPFTPNLKVDLLPEINQSPRILSDYITPLKVNHLKEDVDTFLESTSSAARQEFLRDFASRLRMTTNEETDTNEPEYNVPLINALVFYVGVTAIGNGTPVHQGAPMELYQYLLGALDSEGRYLFLSAIANQLRYPNSHTHYFSCVLLYLFAEGSKEVIKEQITRVLLERLIVNRPHPWGLLITFIELIKNPRYNFWNHSFTRCATDIERLFESVSRSINQT